MTCRRGVKHALLGEGEKINLYDLEGEAVEVATVEEIKVMRFQDVEQEDLTINHDPDCRDFDGLLMEMQECYDDFDLYEIVTLVYFKIIE